MSSVWRESSVKPISTIIGMVCFISCCFRRRFILLGPIVCIFLRKILIYKRLKMFNIKHIELAL